MPSLTKGSLLKICQGGTIEKPVLQVVNCRRDSGASERFRLNLSDGQYSNAFAMLATELNYLVHSNELPDLSIIRVDDIVINSIQPNNNVQMKKVVVVLSLTVLMRGDQVKMTVGDPRPIGQDGKLAPQIGSKRPLMGSESNLPFKKPQLVPSSLRPEQSQSAGTSLRASSAYILLPINALNTFQNRFDLTLVFKIGP